VAEYNTLQRVEGFVKMESPVPQNEGFLRMKISGKWERVLVQLFAKSIAFSLGP